MICSLQDALVVIEELKKDNAMKDKMISAMISLGKVFTVEEIDSVVENEKEYVHGSGWVVDVHTLRNELGII